MVDHIKNETLVQITRKNDELFREDKETKAERLEARIHTLLQDRSNLSPAEVASLRSEAANLDKVADFAETLAKNLESSKKEKDEKKKQEEIKAAHLATLGIPADFIQQLGLLSKAGPEALREGAALYRTKAKEFRETADFKAQEMQRLDKEIKTMTDIRSIMKQSEDKKVSVSLGEYMAQVRYQEALRDKADDVLREVLQQMENG